MLLDSPIKSSSALSTKINKILTHFFLIRYWHIDNLCRILFYIFLLFLGIILLMFVCDRKYLFKLIVDIYYSAKFLIKNNLVIRPEVIERCNRS